jgi:hypothetical protein
MGRSKNYIGEPPRFLDDRDLSGWFNAAIEAQTSRRTQEDIARHIKSRNPIRWRRLQRDLRWVKKEMKKLGLNPEDARWLL